VRIVVSFYLVEDKTGRHRLLTMNERAIELFGGQGNFEKCLEAQFLSFELVLKAVIALDDDLKVCKCGDSMEKQLEHRRLIAEIALKHPEIVGIEPWLPEGGLIDSPNRIHRELGPGSAPNRSTLGKRFSGEGS